MTDDSKSGANSVAALNDQDFRSVSWGTVLRGAEPKGVAQSVGEPVRCVDLFSASGGFSFGTRCFCVDNRHEFESLAAVDVDADALAVHTANHETTHVVHQAVDSLVDFRVRHIGGLAEFSYSPELVGAGLPLAERTIDVVLAGPPCQGHSNLNNHTRRHDRRNIYYLSAVAFAVAANARSLAIENVPAVVHDKAQVVATARALLEANHYHVEDGVFAADKMGWPQTRKRHFLVARRDSRPLAIDEVASRLQADSPMSVSKAIGYGQRLSHDKALHKPTETTPEIQTRIDQLFDTKKYELDDQYRPPSHVDGHTYSASYGRMRPREPAPTITTGFMTPGRGRFIHPSKRRTITPAEAARLQGFPDTYKWRPTPDSPPPTRTQLAKWIGDAVPLPLGYAAAMSALGPDLMDNPPRTADTDATAA